MWKTFAIESTDTNRKFGIEEEGAPITHRQFMELLRESGEFRKYYNHLLAECGFEAFFWENRPLVARNLDEEYECNLIDSGFLAGRSPDTRTFRQYFEEGERVVTFPNLGGDALLVVPCPRGEDTLYTHIGNFVREAGAPQVDEFWRVTAEKMMEAVGEEPRWLSTSGLGVFWLHARIDSVPKYYQTREYKRLD